MAPARKKSKPNTQAPEPAASEQSQAPELIATPQLPSPEGIDTTPPAFALQNNTLSIPTSSNRNSWYSKSSWRSKASPLTETAKESISVAKGVTNEALAEGSKQIAEISKQPGRYVSKSFRGSRKSIPITAEPTRVHATSDSSGKSRASHSNSSEEKLRGIDGAISGDEKPGGVKGKAVVVEEAPLPPEPDRPGVLAAEAEGDAKSAEGSPRPQSGAWFGWWSRPDGYGNDNDKARDKQRDVGEEASRTPLPGTPVQEQSEQQAMKQLKDPSVTTGDGPDPVSEGARTNISGLQSEMSTNQNISRGWFGLWSSAQNEQARGVSKKDDGEPAKTQADKQSQPEAPHITVSAEPGATQKDSDTVSKSSGWAFWSSDKPKESTSTPGQTQRQIGELAVADTPSQSHPEAAQFNEQRDQSAQAKTNEKRNNALLRPKRGRPDKAKDASSGESSAPTPAVSQIPSPAVSQQPSPAETPREQSEAPKPIQRGKQLQTRPNHTMPSFHDTYPPLPQPSYIERLTQYVAQTMRISNASPPALHVYRCANPPRIKRAIALGIHGFFPTPLIQKVLGQPTGTSIRFSNYAAHAIKEWCELHQPNTPEVEVEKVALEGEGFVADRVTTLWKLMLNWLSHLRAADFILVACHSQGVPVAIMLVAKLIQLGCLSPHARVGVCAMAGINLGPFQEYKSRLFGGSALELFEFSEDGSKVSKAYAESLDICLRNGVRVTYVGSLDDQLVSLESSLYTPLSHPYVHRATFIDGRLHAPNFLTHLVVFALKLRNLGVSDHGLLRELSGPLAGSLVGGEGHSRVYDDAAVYRLAVEFALQSTDVAPSNIDFSKKERDKAREAAITRRGSLGGTAPSSTAAANIIRRGSLSGAASLLPGVAPVITPYAPAPSGAAVNPYYLPWAVRGMLEEGLVKSDENLRAEMGVLVREFEEWRPSSKVLKDVRWRLEGVRGML